MRIRSAISSEAFTELVRPKLILFLSVDVVGSTDMKHQRLGSKEAQPWLGFFVNFYTTFPDFVDVEVAEQASRLTIKERNKLRQLRLWKILGDELIFTVEIAGRFHAGLYLRAFRRALQQAAKNWRITLQDDLPIKGTAWLAGFPLGNAEIPLDTALGDSENGDKHDHNYIGPYIDTGLRLKDHATPRKLILSADLAYLLISAGKHGLRIFFDGDEALKGVMKGKHYPIVWADCEDLRAKQSPSSLHHIKDRLLGRKAANVKSLKSYLLAWLDDSKGKVKTPFIYTDQFSDLREPKSYRDEHKAVVGQLYSTYYRMEQEKNGGESRVPDAIAAFLRRKAS